MNAPPLGGRGGPNPDQANAPQTFVRPVTTPAALPWEQSRAAGLEAALSMPSAKGDLRYRLVRTKGWRPGQPGRFAAVYLKGAAPEISCTAEILVEGRALKIAFISDATRRRQIKEQAVALVAFAGPAALFILALSGSIAVRSDRELRLQALEAKAARAELFTKRLAKERAEARLFSHSGLADHTLKEAQADLSWLARNRNLAAHVQAIHWEGGLMTITARGDTPPLRSSERELRRSAKPLQPGLWLWGVGPARRVSMP